MATGIQIGFCDLSRSLAAIRRDVDAAITRVVSSGWFLRGPETTAFEEEWAERCGQAYSISCNSGTDALTLAALALNLKTATIPANTLPLTGIGLYRAGVALKIADVDDAGYMRRDGCHDAVPVLLFGRLPRSDECHDVLYDAAHAHGWKPTGTAAFSFYPTKTLGALGDGGAVTTNDAHLAAEMRALSGRDDVLYDGRQLTSRMDEVQAAVLRVKLRHLDAWLDERQQIAAHYDRRLKPHGLILGQSSLSHLYVIRTPQRDLLQAYLAAAGIATKVHWPSSLNMLSGPWTTAGTYQGAKLWSETVLSLPCYPGLTCEDIEYICDHIETFRDQNSEKQDG